MIGLWWLLTSAAGADPGCLALGDGAARLEGDPGSRRIALVVGVGDYQYEPNGQSVDLPGPPGDAARIRDLLVADYGFPAANVCLLTDHQATRARYLQAWNEHLGAAVAGDTVVYYFAGHGSQAVDLDGPQDEPDGLDETFLLHDSRTNGVGDVRDDELNGLLADLMDRTADVTVLIDACHAGSPTRGPLEAGLAERWVPMAEPATGRRGPAAPTGWSPRPLPQLVTLTAAQDGHPALERDGRGIFTTALLQALQRRTGVAASDVTWHQVAHDVARWVAALHSWQRPSAEGALDRPVFGTLGVVRGGPWMVVAVSDKAVMLEGPPLPGWAAGALVAVVGDDDAGVPRAQVRLDEVSATSARGEVVGRPRKRPRPGDACRLEAPGHDLTSIRVRIEPGIPGSEAVRAALAADPVLGRTVHLVNGPADFVLRPGPGRTVDVVGADGVRRNRLATDGAMAVDVAHTLGLYARQAALLALSGEAGQAYPADLFELRILPLQGRPGCARTPYVPTERAVPWAQVPMCNPVQLQVTLVKEPPQPLYLGILYLSGNGSVHAWPRGGNVEVLTHAGDQFVQSLGWVTPPLNTPDRLVVFGTHDPVDWSRLEAPALTDVVATRGIGPQGFLLAAVAGADTRGAWTAAADGLPALTAGLISLEVVADPARWTAAERDTTSVCASLRKGGCADPAATAPSAAE